MAKIFDGTFKQVFGSAWDDIKAFADEKTEPETEIFELGRHRLMCADACEAANIAKLIADYKVDLILTDPPYGMKCQEKSGIIGEDRRKYKINLFTQGTSIKSKKYPMMIGDDNSETARKNYEITKNICKKKIIFGGQYFADFLPINGGWIFWDKMTGDTNFSDGELAWRSWGMRVKKYQHLWNGVLRAGSRLYNGRSRVHPTQKPVELFAKIIDDYCEPDGVVLDCFGGSGTTLLACELTGRTCLMMEMSPEYCEIIKSRYKKITSQGNLF
ncbi:MAG: site-specific DNA-methyltransferase [Synergistaceae bacterium]|nr:site-specific DNA-methyltransferase [Synergistaceae bacterium]